MKAIKITKNTIPMILLEKGSFLEWELELCVGLYYVVAEEIPIKIRELQWKDCIIAEKELHDTLEVDGDISMNKWISIKFPECFPSPYLILTESFKNILWCLKQNWSSNDNSHSQKGED